MAMSAFPRIVLVTTTYFWDGGFWTLPAGTIIDCAPGSALEQAIGSQNLGTLSNQALQDAAAGAAGATSN
jgi:hypothetical protein